MKNGLTRMVAIPSSCSTKVSGANLEHPPARGANVMAIRYGIARSFAGSFLMVPTNEVAATSFPSLLQWLTAG
jgi:hypothetical protein